MKETKYNALDIARYVINYSLEINSPVSNLKLQKLLYFIQGNFLRILDRPCFKDDIEAWKYGPVIPIVYREFKKFGSNYIGKIEYVYDLENNKFKPVKREFNFHISEEEKKVIESVIQECKNFSSSYLVELTHKQSPWIKAYRKYDKTIDIDSMKEFFCNE